MDYALLRARMYKRSPGGLQPMRVELLLSMDVHAHVPGADVVKLQ